MKGYKKRSVSILISVVCLLLFSTIFMLSLLNRITDKMDQGSNERMINSTRMIQSSIHRLFRNDEERLDSFAGLYALRGGSAQSTSILANYVEATDFYRFFYIDLNGTGTDSSGEAVDAASLPFEETALSMGQGGYSDAYIGSSGRLQITFQAPVFLEGEQIGALYADKTLSTYKEPSLFTFGNGAGCAFIVNGSGSWIIESTGSETNDIFAFLKENGNRSRIQVSNNVRELCDTLPEQVVSQPDILFERCGVPEDDENRNAFFAGNLKEKVRKEYRAGTEAELQRWTEIHYLPADYGQYLAVLRDTTSEHHMREDLADALLQSQENNRARTAFFSSMSHDIRTPMNGIIGMTAIARANLDNQAKVADCLNKISSASDHLLSLINEVLDMSRIESGKFSLKCEPVNLPELISNVLLLIKPDLTKKSHTMHVKSTVLDYDIVMGDALHIQKILMNLLSNAVKYTPDCGEISIGLQEMRRNERMVDIIFSVEDNGIGMEPGFVERIFNPFERAEDNRLSRITGTGLGMAITKNIIDIMGGTIQVESTPGAGSRFMVTLTMPVYEADGPETESLDGYTVLVVDDNADTCEGIQIMLEEAGGQVDWCLSGREAVEKADKAHQAGKDYFAVIVDWKMAEMDGIETARRLRTELGADIPIILLSAYNWEEVEQEALEAGINGFLTKPIFRSELVQKLHFYIMGPSAKTQEAPRQIPEYKFDGLHILIAEDNELNREIAAELLTSAGVRVDSAENGLQALRKMEQSEPGDYDMILMDVHMPEMDGLEASRNIRRLPDRSKAGIPIIAMTADAFAEDILRCKDAGMDGHISKPIDIEKMFEIIRLYDKKGNEGKGK